MEPHVVECMACGTHILNGEAGVELPHIEAAADIPGAYTVSYRFQHRRCFLRSSFFDVLRAQSADADE